jgi:hypothetical protein
MGKGQHRTIDFNWDGILVEEPDLDSLGDLFSEDEVKNAINLLPGHKAPWSGRVHERFFTSIVGILSVTMLCELSISSGIFMWPTSIG